MGHSCLPNQRMRYWPGSSWERHDDRGSPSSDTTQSREPEDAFEALRDQSKDRRQVVEADVCCRPSNRLESGKPGAHAASAPRTSKARFIWRIWPRMPAAIAARLTGRATSLSFKRSRPTDFPCPVTRRNRGPMGKPEELGPGLDGDDGAGRIRRPAADSTSRRQPVLPRSVSSRPLSRISMQPRPSSI